MLCAQRAARRGSAAACRPRRRPPTRPTRPPAPTPAPPTAVTVKQVRLSGALLNDLHLDIMLLAFNYDFLSENQI